MKTTEGPTSTAAEATLPEGVRLRPLATNRDDRGTLTEIFRSEWDTGMEPVQWNVGDSTEHVLRGVHVHIRHFDYLMIIRGSALIGLKDLRNGSPTEHLATSVKLTASEMSTLLIPPGVAHGFYFLEDSTMLYSVSSYWSQDDELGCHWADPDLGIPWKIPEVRLSPRDANASSLSDLMRELEPWQPIERPDR